MSQIIRCLDCTNEVEILYDGIQDYLKTNTEESVYKKIKEVEEMTNFNLKKNICLNCLECLIKEREITNNNLATEISILKTSLDSVQNDIESREYNDISNLNIEDLEKDEQNIKLKLESLKEKDNNLQQELDSLLNELSSLHTEEKNYWNVFNQIEDTILKHEKNKNFILSKYKTYENDIKQFSNASLIDSLFNISCSDKYGVINGARLGFDSTILLDEINAGMGYIIYLTSIVAIKFNFEFSKHELIPMGNYSKIVNKKTGLSFEFNTTGISKVSTDKFNEALVMYLEALKEMNDFLLTNGKVSQKTSEGELNIKLGIEDINGYSIKYDSMKGENWSQAMKYLLILLKSYIYFILKKEDDDYKDILEKAKIMSNLSY
jgi:hypothetical protein